VFYTLILAVTATVSSGPQASELPGDAPDPEQIALLEELAGWIDDDVPAPADQVPLREAIRDHATSFEVFRRFHGLELRYRPLAEVPFGDDIRKAAERYGVDGLLLASMVEVESRFDPSAVSQRGARGLLQVLPSRVGPEDRERLFEAEFNLDVGARYLRRLLDRFGGDLELALAAYNAGPSNVRRYGGVPPFQETRRYVEKVLALYIDYHQAVWQASDSGAGLART